MKLIERLNIYFLLLCSGFRLSSSMWLCEVIKIVVVLWSNCRMQSVFFLLKACKGYKTNSRAFLGSCMPHLDKGKIACI